MNITLHAGEIAKEAGQTVQRLSHKRDLMIQEKGSANDFVTEADFSSQALIKRRVAGLFPADRVIGEEDNLPDKEIIRLIRNNPAHERIWLVDPLDGTINYIKGLLGYGVSVAVFEGSDTVAGAIYQPDGDALYLAERGAGATCNGQRIHCATHARLGEAIGATHVPVSDMNWRRHTMRWCDLFLMQCQNMRMLGASVYEQTRVAAGGLDFYFEIGPHPWDLAAGRLLIEEAGGRVTRLDGGAFDYGWGGVLAASAAIHPEVVRAIREVDPVLADLRG